MAFRDSPACRIILFATLFILHLGVSSAADAPPAKAQPLDVDALAARLPEHLDLYQAIRDDALAAYGKTDNPPAAREKMETLLRLSAYLWVWGDFYGEGLVHKGYGLALDTASDGSHDWQANMLLQEDQMGDKHSGDDNGAHYVNFAVDNCLGTGYPPVFKMEACAFALRNLVAYKIQEHAAPGSAELGEIPHFVKEWGLGFRKLVKARWPHDILSREGACLMDAVQSDKTTLDLIIAEIDQDFNETDPESPVKLDLDGEYFINAAWNARGSDYAGKVTEEGWNLFGQRLDRAAVILEDAYKRNPGEGTIARAMITVELGQGQGRERMEMWFARAIKADPNDYAAYKSKEWYLQPRWYGSAEDILDFGSECVKGGNWAAKVPLILPTGVAECNDDSLYTNPKVWAKLVIVYREYLARYPNSILYRTWFAKHAFDSGHLDEAREQFKILGDNWDRGILSDEEYRQIKTSLAE